MRALTFLTINKEIFEPLKISKELADQLINLNYTIDTYNFNTNTFEDYIDYLDFQEYETLTYIYVGETKRLFNFIDYIQMNIETDLSGLSWDSMNKTTCEISDLLMNYQHNSEFNGEQSIQNGIKALLTGIYPAEFAGILKHIYVSDTDLVVSIDHSILMKMAINSSIIVGNTEFIKNDFLNSPHIVVGLKSYIDSEKFLYLGNDIKKNIKQFVRSGKIELFDSELVVDYMADQNFFSTSSLFISPEGCYLDYKKERLVSLNTSCSYSEYLLKVSEMQKDGTNWRKRENIAHLYFVLANVLRQLKMSDNYVVTPYNALHFDANIEFNHEFNYIGIQNNKNFYCYSLQENKLYETEADFLIILEAYYKDKLEELEDNIKGKITEFKEIINGT